MVYLQNASSVTALVISCGALAVSILAYRQAAITVRSGTLWDDEPQHIDYTEPDIAGRLSRRSIHLGQSCTSSAAALKRGVGIDSEN